MAKIKIGKGKIIEVEVKKKVFPSLTIQEKFASLYGLNHEETRELMALIEEVRKKNFLYSHQLSQYIMDNNLGSDYPNIAGVVHMKQEADEWDYKGGFSRKIYAIICRELNLKNKQTSAKAVGFTPFKEV